MSGLQNAQFSNRSEANKILSALGVAGIGYNLTILGKPELWDMYWVWVITSAAFAISVCCSFLIYFATASAQEIMLKNFVLACKEDDDEDYEENSEEEYQHAREVIERRGIKQIGRLNKLSRAAVVLFILGMILVFSQTILPIPARI